LLKAIRSVLDQFAKALITGAVLKRVGNRCGAPSLLSEVDDAYRSGLNETGRSINCDAHYVIGRVALGMYHLCAFDLFPAPLRSRALGTEPEILDTRAASDNCVARMHSRSVFATPISL
jgi:hypothetical protein